jgi:hypothetical protein
MRLELYTGLYRPIEFMSSYIGLVSSYHIELYKAHIELYRVHIELYRAHIQLYKAHIELYRAYLQLYKTDIDLYRAYIGYIGLMSSYKEPIATGTTATNLNWKGPALQQGSVSRFLG